MPHTIIFNDNTKLEITDDDYNFLFAETDKQLKTGIKPADIDIIIKDKTISAKNIKDIISDTPVEKPTIDVYGQHKDNKKAAMGMFRGLCEYIREQGGMERLSIGAIQLYNKMQNNLKNNHKINAYYKP